MAQNRLCDPSRSRNLSNSQKSRAIVAIFYELPLPKLNHRCSVIATAVPFVLDRIKYALHLEKAPPVWQRAPSEISPAISGPVRCPHSARCYTRTPVSMVNIGKLSGKGYLRRDDTIHQKCAMSFLSNIWSCRIDEGTTAHFGRSSHQADQDILDALNKPALWISENVGIACARRKVVYDDIGIGGYWA